MAAIIGKAKKLRRKGHFPVEEFKEIKLEPHLANSEGVGFYKIELTWQGGQIIRFALVEHLIDFLKKVA